MTIGNNEVLSRNYEKRVQQFILDMIEKPIILRDYDKEMLESRNIAMTRSSTRLRNLPSVTTNNSIDDHHMKQVFSDSNIKSSSKIKNKNNHLIQPFMRFTAKDDISRICDVLNTDYKTVLKQKRESMLLESQSLKYQRKIKEIKEKEEKDKKHKKSIRMHSEPNNFYSSNKRPYPKVTIKKEIAKELLKEYHIKTHFQAASVFSLKPDDSYDEENDNDQENESSPRKGFHSQATSKEKKLSSFIHYNSHKKNNQQQKINHLSKLPHETYSSFDNHKEHDYQSEIASLQNDILSHSQWNINPKKTNDSYPQSSINYLLNLSKRQFASNLQTQHKELKSNHDLYDKYFSPINDRIKESNQIVIDNVVYNKNNVKDISNCILRKCNYFNQKHKVSPTIHNGEGKMMFTNGLSVRDFIMKHSLYTKGKKTNQ